MGLFRKKKLFLLALLWGIALVFTGLLLAYVLAPLDIAVLHPKGWVGREQRDLLVIATLLMLLVVLPVFAITVWVVWKYRDGQKGAAYMPEWNHSTLLETIWWGAPFAIIAVLSVLTYKGCHKLDPFKPLVSDKKPLTIQVIALQWKWLFLYPEYGIATVNFLQFPEKVPLRFEITGDAPMNSFWIPDLGGQIYSMAGMKTKLHLIADRQGDFRGSSAHLSGEGFAGMVFTARSSSEEAFFAWVDSVKSQGSPFTLQTYEELTRPSSYLPAAVYQLEVPDLYERVVMRYMHP